MEVSDYFADFEVSESHIPPPLTFSLFPFFPCPFFLWAGGGMEGWGGGGGGAGTVCRDYVPDKHKFMIINLFVSGFF